MNKEQFIKKIDNDWKEFIENVKSMTKDKMLEWNEEIYMACYLYHQLKETDFFSEIVKMSMMRFH